MHGMMMQMSVTCELSIIVLMNAVKDAECETSPHFFASSCTLAVSPQLDALPRSARIGAHPPFLQLLISEGWDVGIWRKLLHRPHDKVDRRQEGVGSKPEEADGRRCKVAISLSSAAGICTGKLD